MASNPLISLQARAPDTATTFNNALTSIRQGNQDQREAELQSLRNDLLNTQIGAAQQTATDAKQTSKLKSIATGALQLSSFLTNNDTEGARNFLNNRIATLDASEIDSSDSKEALALLDSNPALLAQRTNEAVKIGQQLKLIQTPGGGRDVSFQTFAPEIDPATGETGVVQINPNTGAAEFKKVPGAPVQLTQQQKNEQAVTQAQNLSNIEISEAEKKATTNARVSRVSQIKKELGERNRTAARSQVQLNEALILAKRASQGIEGTSKLRLSKIFPGIDVTDEAALDAALKSLALDQLQKFKGPTTDFEFGVVENIAGEIGNSKESNIARINALNRASWFNQQEFDQFKEFTAANGDPDNFKFDFNKVIKTKKGPFSLRDIQDTAVQNNLSIEDTLKRLNE